jgi:steroid delta-isomerase-like uncharacterized protein
VNDAARQLVARFYEDVLNGKRLELLDELITDDFNEHGKPPLAGREAFRAFLEGLAAGLPDVELEVDDWIVADDRVVARCRVSGTHRGELFGYPATGRRIGWTAIHIWRLADGHLADRWSEADLFGIMEQLKGS